jgi:hypothetical protein
MKSILILAATLFVVAANASASSSGDPFAGVQGIPLGEEEAAALEGGDVAMTLNRERSKLKVQVDFESESPTGRSKVSYSYEVDAHNRVVDTKEAGYMPVGGETPVALKDKGKLTSRPGTFPAGTWEITAVKKRTDKFGPNMMSTDAVGTVEVFDRKGKSLGFYKDGGYAIHSNTNDFSKSKSWGCIIVKEADNRKLADEIARDKARNGKQTLTVASDKKASARRPPAGRRSYQM